MSKCERQQMMTTTTEHNPWYADSLQQMEQALYGPAHVEFPIQVELV